MQRISAIIADETPIPLCSGGKVILHIAPLESFSPEVEFNMKQLGNTLPEKLAPMFKNRGWGNRLSFDGFVTFAGNERERSHAYTQFYRSGIIEAVDAAVVAEEWAKEADGQKYLHAIIQVLIESLNKYLSLLQELGVNPLLVIFITVTGVKDFAMGVSNRMMNFRADHGRKIDRDSLNCPEHLLENYDQQAEEILRPMFDIMWNACGFEQTPYFDANGNCRLN